MDELELIKQKISIVELISEFTPLKKTGVNFKANCPFHQENTPSFVVSPERNIWHCFGCDRGGDIFKFLMEKEGLEFKEALEILAQRAGVVLKKTSKREESKKDKYFEINKKAEQFYHYLLTQHPLGVKALAYLKKRGLTEETIKLFNLGYAPQNWEALTKFLRKRGYSNADLIESGLCVPSKSGCYDRFRGRIIFPLVDTRDRIIGFSGRILDVGDPKYINTPQTEIFDKRRFLLGMNLTKGDIREKNEAILVEGEMDMLLSFQSGVKNVISSKGTALTEEQVELIKKYTDNISLCFDTDLAGDAASRRGIEMADRAGINLKVIQFTGAKDPAEVILDDPTKWQKAVADAMPIYDYYLQSVERRFDPTTALGKKEIFAELLPIWKKITDPITKEHYIEKLAALVQVKPDFVRKELLASPIALDTAISRQPSVNALPANVQKTTIVKTYDRRTLLEEYLIALLLHIPMDCTYVPNFSESLLTQEELKQIYVLLVIFLDGISFKGSSFKIAEFAKTLPADLVPLIDRLYLMQIDEKLEGKKVWEKEIETVLLQLKKMLLKSSLEKLSMQIKNAQEFGKMDILEVLNRKFRDLSVRLKNL